MVYIAFDFSPTIHEAYLYRWGHIFAHYLSLSLKGSKIKRLVKHYENHTFDFHSVVLYNDVYIDILGIYTDEFSLLLIHSNIEKYTNIMITDFPDFALITCVHNTKVINLNHADLIYGRYRDIEHLNLRSIIHCVIDEIDGRIALQSPSTSSTRKFFGDLLFA